MKPIRVPILSPERLAALEELYRTPKARLRTRAQMVLLAAERGLTASEIAQIPDRASKRGDGKTLAQALPGRGSRGLARCAPSGRAAQGYGGVPRAVGGGGTSPSEEPWAAVLFVDAAPSGRLHGRADRHQGRVRDRSGAPEGSGDRAQPSAAHHHEPRPRVRPQKRRSQRPATTSERETISTTPTSST